jgi:hypothetical protein
MSPPRNGEGRATTSPADTKEVDTHTNGTEYIAGIRRRRAATYRLPRRDCGCVDPWTCRCDDRGPSDRMVAAYEAAAETLLNEGFAPAPFLPEMRAMWSKSNRSREMVRTIASRWEVSA